MNDRKPTLYARLHLYLGNRPGTARRGPKRRDLDDGGEPVPADPKPRPTLLSGGAEAPVE
jgi:hypothetical protein